MGSIAVVCWGLPILRSNSKYHCWSLGLNILIYSGTNFNTEGARISNGFGVRPISRCIRIVQLEEMTAGIKNGDPTINKYTDDTTLVESKEVLREFIMKVKIKVNHLAEY